MAKANIILLVCSLVSLVTALVLAYKINKIEKYSNNIKKKKCKYNCIKICNGNCCSYCGKKSECNWCCGNNAERCIGLVEEE